MLSAEFHVLPSDMQAEALAFVAEMRGGPPAFCNTAWPAGEFHFAGDARAMAAVMFAAPRRLATGSAWLDAAILTT